MSRYNTYKMMNCVRKLDTTDMMLLVHLSDGHNQRTTASILNLTPPAINHRMRKIREVFETADDPIFKANYVTSHGRVRDTSLTERGEQIAQRCLQFLDSLDV